MMLALLFAAVAASHIPPDLAAAVHGYDQAQIDGNRTGLERWLADDYLLVNSGGATETKAQLIADYTAQGFDLEPFTVEKPVAKVWRGGAVMGGIATLKGTDSGKRFKLRLRFADIWARRSGRWQVIYTQVAKAP
jgi:hypothetical protein